MPVPFLAHQAPVLPLKRWRPGLDGVALVVGSAMPDMARATQKTTPHFFFDHPLWWDGHTPTQQFVWCLPVGLVVTWLVRRLLAPRLAGYLPDLGVLHLRDLRHVGRTRHRWWVIAGSVLIGSFSHVVLDLLTHSDRALGDVLPALGTVVGHLGAHPVDVGNVLQTVASVGLSVVALWELARIGRDRLVCRWSGVEPDDPPPPAGLVGVRVAAVLVVVVAAVWSSTQLDDRGLAISLMTWVWLTLFGLSGLALVVAATTRRPAPSSVLP